MITSSQYLYPGVTVLGLTSASLGILYYYHKKEEGNVSNENYYKQEHYYPNGIEFIKINPGLHNFGNTCFANTIIQSLSSCIHFVDYLLYNKYNTQLPEELKIFNNLSLKLVLAISGNNKSFNINEALNNFLCYLEETENFDFVNQ